MVKRPPRPRPPRGKNSRTTKASSELPQRQYSWEEPVSGQATEDAAVFVEETEQSAFIPENIADFEDSQSASKSVLEPAEKRFTLKSNGTKIRGLLSKMRGTVRRDSDSEANKAEQIESFEDAPAKELSTSDDSSELEHGSVMDSKTPARLTWLLGSRSGKANLASPQSGATTVSLQPLLQERQKARRRRIWATIGAVVTSVFIVVAIVLSLFVFPVFTLKASGLKVVGVEGEQQQKIVADSKKFVGKPILGMWTSELKSVLLKNEWVKDAEISRRFPSSATIKIYPRVPTLAVKRGSELVAYDDDATELKFADAKQLKLPIVEVKADGEDFKRSMLNTSAIMNELPKDLREKVRQYTALSPTNIQFTLHSGAVVKWGAREDSKLKARVLQVLLQVPARVYDVTSPTAPVTS